MTCQEKNIDSNDFYDLIIDDNFPGNYRFPDCVQPIDGRYAIGYYPRQNLPDLNVADYGYSAIPNLFCLTDYEALEESNILFLQNQPVLELQGQGVLIGFVDTGIDYQNPIFQNPDGSTRIAAIWDQTQSAEHTVLSPEMETAAYSEAMASAPQGFLYGREYPESLINRALASENPLSVVPSRDEVGHGTFLAGVACGGPSPANEFIGAAPRSSIAVVKCKEAKQNLRDYYHVQPDTLCFQENDIMAGVAWLDGLAGRLGMPLVVCIAMGSSLGDHMGDDPLSLYLNNLGQRRGRVPVISAGNEANARHHYQNLQLSQGRSDDVEISVGEGVSGFVLELWAKVPNLFQVAVLSPTGELYQPTGGISGQYGEHYFLFENTTVSLQYDIALGANANQLAFLRFTTPLAGLWTIRVTAVQSVQGGFSLWLPQRQWLSGDVFFLRPVPEVTATMPSYTSAAISVGASSVGGSSLFPDSGRGFGANGALKPDLTAPGTNITGPDLFGGFTTASGTSVAAALTSGACAQLLEWGIIKGQYASLNATEMRAILARGARRSIDRIYPNPEWGFGSLDVYEALNQLRVPVQSDSF